MRSTLRPSSLLPAAPIVVVAALLGGRFEPPSAAAQELIGYPYVQQYNGSHYGYNRPRYQRYGLTIYVPRFTAWQPSFAYRIAHRPPLRSLQPGLRSARTIASTQTPVVLNQSIQHNPPPAPPQKRKKLRNRSPDDTRPRPQKSPPRRMHPEAIGTPSENPAKKTELPDDLAWRYLAAGTSKAAQRRFAWAASQFPEKGPTQIGLGVAAAIHGDPDTSVKALRRAFEADPSGSVTLPPIPGVNRQIERLVARLNQSQGKTPDQLFALAALNLCLGNRKPARQAINQAVDSGDHSESTQNIVALLEAR